LRSARIPDLDAAFSEADARPRELIERVFRLPAAAEIAEVVPGGAARRGMVWLRDNAERRWAEMLKRAAWLWLEHRNVAKATMHGFPVIPGAHVEGPPGAGELAEDIHPRKKQRYAVAVTSKVQGKKVITDRTTVPLDESTVGSFARQARVTIRATVELADAQADSTMNRHRAVTPTRALKYLDAEVQEALEMLAGNGR
jgi:hypothetical protein